MSELYLNTEIELVSKGFFYNENSPYAGGKLEMKYITSKEEDILTNPSYLGDGSFIEKLLRSIIVKPHSNHLDEMLICDFDPLILDARILNYGSTLEFEYENFSYSVDLSNIKTEPFDYTKHERGKNEFTYTLPKMKKVIVFKLLTLKEQNLIKNEINSLKEKNITYSETAVKYRHQILSVDGIKDKIEISKLSENMLIQDSIDFKKYINSITPSIQKSIDLISLPNKEGKINSSKFNVYELIFNRSFFWSQY